MNYQLNSYLNFDGDCAEAFALYAEAFGGTPQIMRFGDMPDSPAEHKDKVLHVNLNIGSTMLMGSDCIPGFGNPLVKGNNQSVVIQPESREEADRLFAILSKGGQIEMPMSDEFFGYFGTFVDRFGICWMIVIQAQDCSQEN